MMLWGQPSSSTAALWVKTAQTGRTQPLRQDQTHIQMTHGLSQSQRYLAFLSL